MSELAGLISLRPEEPADEGFLLAVYASVRAGELALTNWDAATKQAFVEMQFRAMRAGYRSSFPQAEFNIIMHSGNAIGRMVIDRAEPAICVVDIALLPEHRNKRVGTFLMQRLLEEAAESGKPVRLVADKSGQAGRWYARLGFQVIEETAIAQQWEWNAPR